MKTPLTILAISTALCALGFGLNGWSDLLLLGVPCVLASLWLIWRAWRRPNWIVIDGSNVMYWHGGTPNIGPVNDVIRTLKQQGFEVGIMFDANAGHLLKGRYLHHHDFSKLLKMPESHIMVVPKETPADPYILQAARDYGARIVSNDRFRDWYDDFPEAADPGFLIKGEYSAGQLVLDLD